MARNAHPVHPGEPTRRDPRAAKAHDVPADRPAFQLPRSASQSGPDMNSARPMPKVNRDYAD